MCNDGYANFCIFQKGGEMKNIVTLSVISLLCLDFSGCFSQYYANRSEDEYYYVEVIVEQPVEINYTGNPVVFSTPPNQGVFIPEQTYKIRDNSSNDSHDRRNPSNDQQTKLRDNSGSRTKNSGRNSGYDDSTKKENSSNLRDNNGLSTIDNRDRKPNNSGTTKVRDTGSKHSDNISGSSGNRSPKTKR